MTHYEVAFKLQHEGCPYNEFSKNNPATTISHWCNWSRDVLEIAHDGLMDSNLQKSISELTRALGSKVIRRSLGRSNLQVILQHCACENIPPPTLPVIERSNCLELQPAVYTEGWEWYRVIAFTENDIKRLFRDLEEKCNVQVVSRKSISEESVRDTYLLSASKLFGNLTNKQVRALIMALDNGYYKMPRSSTAAQLANLTGQPRTSFVDHLRKAENKVLHSVAPYLRLGTSAG